MITIYSPAKINLILKVMGKRSDGYHNLETIMQEINLYDTLEFQLLPNHKIIINNTGLQIPCNYHDNLIFKATQHFFEATKIKDKGILINIHKKIPIGSGLGGGSSNAVATLLGLNKLFESHLTYEQLNHLASNLGSDTVFFLHGGRCFCSGRGEIIAPMQNTEATEVVLFIPNFSTSTASVFKNFHSGQIQKEFTFNDLADAAFSVSPQLKEIQAQLNTLTEKTWRLTGSGSTFFFIQPFDEEKVKVSNLNNKLPGRFIETEFSYRGCYVL